MILLLKKTVQRTFNCNKFLTFNLQVMFHHHITKSSNSFNLLKVPRNFITTKRTLFYRIYKYFKKPSVEELKLADNIPDSYNLIYRNTMHRYMLSAQIITSVSTAFATVMLLLSEFEFNELKMEEGEPPPRSVQNEEYLYFTCFVALTLMLQVMIVRLPIRIYNLPSEQQYVFVFYGLLPSTRRQIVCKANDVIKLRETGILPWRDSRYKIVNQGRVIMIENFFRKPIDLNIMIGYQKQPEDYD